MSDLLKLLPPHLGGDPFVLALFDAIQNEIDTHLNPAVLQLNILTDIQSQPDQALDQLAVNLSTLGYDQSFTQPQKAGLVEESIRLHRKVGTKSAITNAIKSVGYNSDVTEWFDASPNLDRGKFAIKINIQGEQITSDSIDRVLTLVDANKRKSQHLQSIGIQSTVSGTAYAGGGVSIGQTITVIGDLT